MVPQSYKLIGCSSNSHVKIIFYLLVIQEAIEVISYFRNYNALSHRFQNIFQEMECLGYITN
jgi:hypothetical protein